MASWLATEEGVFELRGFSFAEGSVLQRNGSIARDYNCPCIRLVEMRLLYKDLIDHLWTHLLTDHQLTDIHGAEKLLALPPLGKQKLSELLEEMIASAPEARKTLFSSIATSCRSCRESSMYCCQRRHVRLKVAQRVGGPDLGPLCPNAA